MNTRQEKNSQFMNLLGYVIVLRTWKKRPNICISLASDRFSLKLSLIFELMESLIHWLIWLSVRSIILINLKIEGSINELTLIIYLVSDDFIDFVFCVEVEANKNENRNKNHYKYAHKNLLNAIATLYSTNSTIRLWN